MYLPMCYRRHETAVNQHRNEMSTTIAWSDIGSDCEHMNPAGWEFLFIPASACSFLFPSKLSGTLGKSTGIQTTIKRRVPLSHLDHNGMHRQPKHTKEQLDHEELPCS